MTEEQRIKMAEQMKANRSGDRKTEGGSVTDVTDTSMDGYDDL
jgi:hypothetical protein